VKVPRRLCGLGARAVNNEIREAGRYYGVDPSALTTAVIALSVLSTLATFILLQLTVQNMLVSFATANSVGYAAYFLLMNQIPSGMRAHELEVLKGASRTIEEFHFGKTYTSMFDAMRSGMLLDNRVISKEMEQNLKQVVNGLSPERVLRDYLQKQASTPFREGLSGVLWGPGGMTEDQLREFVQLPEHELKERYKEASSKLETKIAVFMAFGLFSPVILATGIGLLGISANTALYLYLPFHTFVLTLLYRYFMNPGSGIADG